METDILSGCECPMPSPVTTEEVEVMEEVVEEVELKEEVAPTVDRGSYVLFDRNGKVRTGKVITKGAVNIGLDVVDMKSNTKIDTATKLVPVTVFITEEVLAHLESR